MRLLGCATPRAIRPWLHKSRVWIEERMQRLVSVELSDDDLVSAIGGSDSIETVVQRLRERTPPRFIGDPDEKLALVSSVRRLGPAVEEHTISAADRVCEHTFDMLGSGPINLDDFNANLEVDDDPGYLPWHYDFKSGHRFRSDLYFKRVRSAPFPGGFDIKVPWELSRCQHLCWLGQAYWFTGDERYPREFVDQVSDWLTHNTPYYGVNWCSAMDVAIRAVNWLWAHHFFRDSPSITDPFRFTFFKSLLIHGRFIFRNLEHSAQRNNHYIADLVGLFYIGTCFPASREAQRWVDFSLEELEKEILRQVHIDGMCFEASLGYHRLVAELFLSALLLAHSTGRAFSDQFMKRLESMLEFTMWVTKPDGTVPLIGDFDNGRLHRLKVWSDPEREWIDHRYLLAIGAVIFGRPDFAQAAGDQWEEAYWLLGARVDKFREQARSQDLSGARLGSRAFPHGGIYVMRKDDFYVAISSGAETADKPTGHGHCDPLSFELFGSGNTFVLDPGSYVYTADYESRHLFRSAVSHNVVMLDEDDRNSSEESVAEDVFRVYDRTTRVSRWVTAEEYDLFEGERGAYGPIPYEVSHQRQICLDKSEGCLLIHDLFRGQGFHRFRFLLHFGPSASILGLGDADEFHVTCDEGLHLMVMPFARQQLACSSEMGDVSYSYGRRVKAPVITYGWDATVPVQFGVVMWPYRNGTCRGDLRERASAVHESWSERMGWEY